MDPDQDILDQMARKERGSAPLIMALIASFSLFAGIMGYFTIQLELHSSQEVSIDCAALTAIGAIVVFSTAYRKFR